MRNLFKVAALAFTMLFAVNFAWGQAKIGYVNFQLLGSLLPEAKTVKAQVDDYSKQFIDQLTTMSNELQAKGRALDAQSAGMADAVRLAKQQELRDLEKRMQDYNTMAQQKVEEKSAELVKPLSDRLHTAVAQVAKEKGYAYVIDTSQGSPLIVSPDGDDLMDAVKAKLGIK